MGANATPCTDSQRQPGDAFCFTNVSQQPLIVLTFDRPLAPSSEFRDNYAIVSGSSGNLAFKRVRIDPVERAAILTLADTTVTGPDVRLAGGTEHRLVIKSSADPRNHLASYEGAKLEGELVVRFTTRATPGDEENRIDPAPSDACETIKVLSSKCAGAPCHGATKVAPAMGLSLVSYEGIANSAIGQRSTLVQTAQHPPPGSGVAAEFPYGMALIEKGSSARSFLIYKIMMDRERTATLEGTTYKVPEPPGIPGGAVTSKTDPLVSVANDLRRRIPGSEMPPRNLPGDPNPSGFGPLPLSELRLIRRWIDDGAPPCVAPSGDAGADAAPDAVTDSVSDMGGD